SEMHKRTAFSLIRRALLGFGLVLGLIFAGFPFYWMLTTSTMTSAERYAESPVLTPNFGSLGEYGSLVTSTPIFQWLGNSAFIAFGVTILSTVIAVLAAYALSRFRFHGKGVAGFLLFTTQMLPEALLIVPLYALFLSAGLLDNLVGIVLIQTAFVMPVAVW